MTERDELVGVCKALLAAYDVAGMDMGAINREMVALSNAIERDVLAYPPSIMQVDDTYGLQGKFTRMTVYALQLEAERDALRTAVKRIDALWHAAGSGPVSAAALRIILTDLACEHMERS